MMGKSSVPAISLCVLALHATILAPYNIAAAEASAAFDYKYWNKVKSKQKRHLRRLGDSQEQKHQGRRSRNDLECRSLGWHADLKSPNGCTDDDVYIDAWLDLDHMFHATPESCCSSHFPGKDCAVTHSGCGSDNSQMKTTLSPCVSPGWHADMINQDGCSNGKDTYLLAWLKQPMKSTMFFSSAQECCDALFKDDCEIHDASCTIGDDFWSSDECESKWHPDITAETTAETGCTNDKTGYPSAWKATSSQEAEYFFSSPQECCEKYHQPDGSCQIRDACMSDKISTIQVTSSTLSTVDDTPCHSGRWHMTRDFSKCSNDFGYPLNWLGDETFYFFDDPKECCVAVFNYEYCEVEDICAPSDVTFTETEVETTATVKTRSPTQEPTPKPSTEMPNELNNSLNSCSKKTRRQCFQEERCQYDKVGRICEDVVSESNTTPEPSPDMPTIDAASPISCGGTSKKLCVRDPECSWDQSEMSCSRQSVIPQKPNDLDDGPNSCSKKTRSQCFQEERCQYDQDSSTCVDVVTESNTTPEPSPDMPTTIDAASPISCGGTSKKLCVKDPECSWDQSEMSCS